MIGIYCVGGSESGHQRHLITTELHVLVREASWLDLVVMIDEISNPFREKKDCYVILHGFPGQCSEVQR